MAWQVAEAAALDMQHIAEQGILNFGSTHARAYIASMLDMFETLAAHPELAAEREASQSKVRIMPCGAHHVVYIVQDQDVLVLRVLHGLQNWFDLL